jgi:hypothetical protein
MKGLREGMGADEAAKGDAEDSVPAPKEPPKEVKAADTPIPQAAAKTADKPVSKDQEAI